MIFNLSGGGGAGLNFKIVGGTSQPAGPTPNMIWLNTHNDITSWEFSPNEPVSQIPGMVWFRTGSTSTVAFNALKKNCITVCPMSAAQWIDDEWVTVEAKSYINGNWTNWRVYLFDNGAVDGLGANWVFRTDNSSVSSGNVGNTLTMNAGTCPGNITNYAAELYLDSAIDCSAATTLNIHFVKIVTTGDGDMKDEYGLYVRDMLSNETLTSFGILNETDWTLTVDVSHLNMIQVQLRTNPWYSRKNTCSLTADSVWLT